MFNGSHLIIKIKFPDIGNIPQPFQTKQHSDVIFSGLHFPYTILIYIRTTTTTTNVMD